MKNYWFATKLQERLFHQIKSSTEGQKTLITQYMKEFSKFTDFETYPNVDSGDKTLLEVRQSVMDFLSRRHMYWTIALCSKILSIVDENAPALAYMYMKEGNVYVNVHPDFLRLSKTDQLAIYLHEVNHIYQFPMLIQMADWEAETNRRKKKDQQRLKNIAADLVVNREVLKLNPNLMSDTVKEKVCLLNFEQKTFVPCKGTDLWIASWGRKGYTEQEFAEVNKTAYPFDDSLSWIQYYKLLLEQKQQEDESDKQEGDGSGSGEGDGGDGELSDEDLEDLLDKISGQGDIDFDSLTPDQQKAIEGFLEKAQQLGEQMAKRAGHVAVDSQMIIKPKISQSVKQALNQIRLLGTSSKWNVEETYSRRNIMFPDSEEIVGEMRSQTKGAAIVIIDTSGSMGQSELEQAVGGLKQLYKKGQVEAVWCLDTKLHKVTKFETNEVKLEGGGGTEICGEHIKEIDKDRTNKAVTTYIYLTDGYVDLKEIRGYFKGKKSKFKEIIIAPE